MKQGDVPTFADVRRDFFDASEGVQCGLRRDGIPVLLLTLTPEGVMTLLSAAHGWQTHQCKQAPEVALFLLHQAATTLLPLLPYLPEDVQKMRPFGH